MNEDLRILRVIYCSFAISTSLFAIVIVGISKNAAPVHVDGALLHILDALSVILIVLSIAIYSAGAIFFRRILRQIGNEFSARVRTAYIVRLAMMEGPAMLGLVGTLLASINGVFYTHPRYWLLGMPYLMLLAFIAQTFPTEKSLADLNKE